MTFYCKGFSIKDFKREIKKRFKGKTGNLFFNTMSDMYYADYSPKYPEKSAADIHISYCFTTGEAKMYGNLEAMIPTIKEFDNLGELFDCLDGME